MNLGAESAVDREVAASIEKLVAFCRARDWTGYDPYDALDSPVFNALPYSNRRLPRLLFTQALKRSPFNVRRLLGIRETQNPKALALFLSAAVRLSRLGAVHTEGLIEPLIDRLMALRSRDVSHWCWGYPFPWQGRVAFVPAGAPNLVCTVFVAAALLDAYEQARDSRLRDMALDAVEYMLDELYWSSEDGAAGFCYPLPSVRSAIHNANLMAAALVCRAHRLTGDRGALDRALRVARRSAARQQANGSWHYGEAASQRWCDNLHTGYNLCALRSIARDAGVDEFDACLRRGFAYYRSTFIPGDGMVAHYAGRTYPVDAHSVAQSIITLVTLADLEADNVRLARAVFSWATTHMWDGRGFFYYRKHRFWTMRTSYMRWSQAWMLLALSTLLGESDATAQPSLRGHLVPTVVA
jgi:hypothetical protein